MKAWQRFFCDKQGNVVIAQRPNVPLLLGLVSWLLSLFLPYGELNFVISLVAFGSLFTFAWLEIFDGSSPFRRVVGAVVMVVIILSKIY